MAVRCVKNYNDSTRHGFSNYIKEKAIALHQKSCHEVSFTLLVLGVRMQKTSHVSLSKGEIGRRRSLFSFTTVITMGIQCSTVDCHEAFTQF